MLLEYGRTNIRNIYISFLAVSIMSLGFVFLTLGFTGLLFPDFLFRRLFLPFASLSSQTGQFRSELTVQMLYREWLNVGLYAMNIIGLMMVVFSIIWRKLEHMPQEEVSAKYRTQGKNEGRAAAYLAAIVLMTIIGAFLRVINLNQSLWGDEIRTLVDFIMPYRIWRYLELGDHLLYTISGLLSVKLFGENEIAVRLPAYLFGVATIPAVYYTAKQIFSRKEALVTAVLLCFAAFHIQYSNEARGYSVFALVSLLSSFFFLKIILLDHFSSKKNIIWFSALTTLGILSHFYYIWVLLAQYLTMLTLLIGKKFIPEKSNLFCGRRGSNILAAIVIGIIAALLINGPWFIIAVLRKYIGWKGAGEAVSIEAISYLITGRQITGFGIFFAAIFLFGLLHLLRQRRFIIVIYFFSLVVFPFLAVRIICKNAFTRYFIYCLPFFLIMIAHVMVTFSDKFSRYFKNLILGALMVIFVILQTPTLAGYYRNYKAGLEDYRAVGRLIDGSAGSGDIVCAIGLANEQAQYYIKKHKVVYLSDKELSHYLGLSDKRIWLIVTFPDFLFLYPETYRTHKIAQEKLRLVGRFPSFYSDLILYVSKVK